MAVSFLLVLVGVFHGYVSGYPTKGMLKIIHIFVFVRRKFYFSSRSLTNKKENLWACGSYLSKRLFRERSDIFFKTI